MIGSNPKFGIFANFKLLPNKCRFCNFGVIVDVPIEVNKVFKCGNPRCGKEICRRCNIDWQQHIGIPCDEIETDADEKFRKQAEERLANAVIRYCHKCKAPIIKETGCNKMTCRCGARMCYLCRQPDIDYDHFCRIVLSIIQKIGERIKATPS
uniref:RING-type domain-containing protein n=1 Tax=Romanomermis culicivorax TaxID=13658 RepID=A0A915KNF2_ROMCU